LRYLSMPTTPTKGGKTVPFATKASQPDSVPTSQEDAYERSQERLVSAITGECGRQLYGPFVRRLRIRKKYFSLRSNTFFRYIAPPHFSNSEECVYASPKQPEQKNHSQKNCNYFHDRGNNHRGRNRRANESGWHEPSVTLDACIPTASYGWTHHLASDIRSLVLSDTERSYLGAKIPNFVSRPTRAD
jgi:hypothetical protein